MTQTFVPFKQKHSFQERRKQFEEVYEQKPGFCPVIVEPHLNSDILPLRRSKFMVNPDCTAFEFWNIVRKFVKLEPYEACFGFMRNELFSPTPTPMSELYKRFAENDGFLYITLFRENTFG